LGSVKGVLQTATHAQTKAPSRFDVLGAYIAVA
jgi:hypothetical protein